MKKCSYCGGTLGQDCYNEYDCGMVSRYNDQHYQQISGELEWQTRVVIPDLESKLKTAKSLIVEMTICYYSGSSASIIEQTFKRALDFCNDIYTVEDGDMDSLPF